MILNLFALTSNPASRIVKFNLSQEIQQDLTARFIQQESIFNQSTHEIIFDGKYKPDPDEVLYIDEYDDIDNLASAILSPLTIDPIIPTEAFFDSIKAIFTGYKDDSNNIILLLQNFDKRRIISTNGFSIFHSDDVYKRIEGIGLTIDHKITAILENKKLKFFSFHNARQIFDLSEYYKEATDDDVNEFSHMENIQVNDTENLISLSDSWVRRKISLIQQSGILGSVPIQQMKVVASEFNVPFKTVEENSIEKVILPDNKPDLKKLLRFLDEDYYKSPLSNTAFVTNSKRELTPQE